MNTPRHPREWIGHAGNAAALLALLAMASALFNLHDGDWHWSRDAQRWLAAAALLLGYSVAVGAGAWRRRRRRQVPVSQGEGAIVVWHASQTGTAEQLAERSAARLREAGLQARAAPLSQFVPDAITPGTRALFVASTTGEGDAPDVVARFVRERMHGDANLAGLDYGVLALGDRDYFNFCAFGHHLDGWLRRHGARPLFDLVEVDNGDDGALRHWQHHLDQLGGRADLPDWQAPRYRPWRLRRRVHLNPGSAGGPVFHLELVPDHAADLQWEAGDIAEIGPRHAPHVLDDWLASSGWDGDAVVTLDGVAGRLRETLSMRALPDPSLVRDADPAAVLATQPRLPHREYSIASIPQDGALHLLVRRMERPDGTPGLGSGWLTQYASVDATVDLRLRSNPGFHAPAADVPLVLVGSGTGMAGLRALLRARVAAGRHRNWLLFGERNAAHDAFHGAEIARWLRDGRLARVDYAWSRDGTTRVYVQDRLRQAGAELRRWVEDGAAIHVCGSLQGMAPGVDAVLRELLGAERLEALLEAGRYRRDVY